MLQSGRLGPKNKGLQSQIVQESRSGGTKDLIDGVYNGVAQHRGVDGPELYKKTVDPFQAFCVRFEPGFGHLTIDVIPEVSPNTAYRGAVVGAASGHDYEHPAEPSTEKSNDP